MILSRSLWLHQEWRSTQAFSSFLLLTRVAHSSTQSKTVSSVLTLDEMSNEGKWFFFCLIIFSNLVFLISWSWNFFSEIRGRCRLKFPKFYTCFCLCCRKKFLSEEVRQEKARDLRENLITEIDSLQSSKMADDNIRVASGKRETG